MKKQILLVFCLYITIMLQATVSKTVNITIPGTLSTALTSTELTTVTNLIVTGTIDARDFLTMRNNMPALSVLNLRDTGMIPDSAFYNCAWLTSIVLPYDETTIGKSAFKGCTGLTSIYIPGELIPAYIVDGIIYSENVTIVGDHAFEGCTGLTSIEIPDGEISFGKSAFKGCTGLTSIYIPGELDPIGKPDGTIYYGTATSVGDSAFANCTGLTSVTFSAGETIVGDHVFNGCTGLTSIEIPQFTRLIGDSAFKDCTNITRVVSKITYPVPYNYTTFAGINKNCILYVPTGTVALYKSTIGWSYFFNIVETTTAIPTITNASINLYPNPITESFQISGLEGIGTMILLDLNGKVVLSKQVISNESISVGTLPKGIYILKVITNEGTIERKVMKK